MSNDEKAEAMVEAFKPLHDVAEKLLAESRKPDDGGWAFPTGYTPMCELIEGPTYGMTLRDHFAAKAMAAHLTNDGLEGCGTENVAAMSYEMADAMIAARKK